MVKVHDYKTASLLAHGDRSVPHTPTLQRWIHRELSPRSEHVPQLVRAKPDVRIDEPAVGLELVVQVGHGDLPLPAIVPWNSSKPKGTGGVTVVGGANGAVEKLPPPREAIFEFHLRDARAATAETAMTQVAERTMRRKNTISAFLSIY